MPGMSCAVRASVSTRSPDAREVIGPILAERDSRDAIRSGNGGTAAVGVASPGVGLIPSSFNSLPHIIHGDLMALAPGTRLGVFEVTAQIGAGGMGEKLCSG